MSRLTVCGDGAVIGRFAMAAWRADGDGVTMRPFSRQAGRCVVGLRPFLLFWDSRRGISGLQAGSGLEQGTWPQDVYQMGACGGGTLVVGLLW